MTRFQCYRNKLMTVASLRFGEVSMSWSSAAEIAMAQEIQQSFERKSKPPTLYTAEYAVRSLSARALSGDYYDFLEVGAGRMAFVLADISGKGLPAALLMASLRASILAQGPDAFNDLPQTLNRVHELFYESSPPGHFASLFFADYNEPAGSLRYVNCGHVPPLLFRDADELGRRGRGGSPQARQCAGDVHGWCHRCQEFGG